MATPNDPVPGTYQHYEGGLYEVLGMAQDPETGKRYVVYQSIGVTVLPADDPAEEPKRAGEVLRTGAKGVLAVCSVKRFTEPMPDPRGGGGPPVPRFRLVSATGRP